MNDTNKTPVEPTAEVARQQTFINRNAMNNLSQDEARVRYLYNKIVKYVGNGLLGFYIDELCGAQRKFLKENGYRFGVTECKTKCFVNW